MATERTPFSKRKHQPVRIARSAGIATRLQDRILLRAERGARDVLCPLDGKTEILCAVEKYLLLETHRCGFNGQGMLDPRVIRQEFPVAEWKQMIPVIGVPICAVVVGKDTGRGPWRVSLVVICCPAYP